LIAAPGSGKRAIALRFIAALACEQGVQASSGAPPETPCGECRACRLVAQEAHADLHATPVPLRVENVRDLISNLSLSPSESAYRSALVADVDLASPSAANALLKTLEEPPSRALLVLTAGSPGQVLPTILSRCRVVPVARRTVDDVVARLVESGVERERAELAARLSDGRLGWAWQSANADFIAARVRWLDELGTILAADPAGRLQRAASLARNGDDLATGLATWRSWARDVLHASAGQESGWVAVDRADDIRAAASRLGLDGAAGLVRSVETAITRVGANANKQLALEALVLELPA
jgi:DNA polymerase-3 subunit delta'